MCLERGRMRLEPAGNNFRLAVITTVLCFVQFWWSPWETEDQPRRQYVVALCASPRKVLCVPPSMFVSPMLRPILTGKYDYRLSPLSPWGIWGRAGGNIDGNVGGCLLQCVHDEISASLKRRSGLRADSSLTCVAPKQFSPRAS